MILNAVTQLGLGGCQLVKFSKIFEQMLWLFQFYFNFTLFLSVLTAGFDSLLSSSQLSCQSQTHNS